MWVAYRMKIRLRSIAVCIAPIFLGVSLAGNALPDHQKSIDLNNEQKIWLDTHNRERLSLGAPALAWDDRLAKDAQSWAEELARTRRFEHALQKGDETDQGENLWMGTASRFSPTEMVGSWIEEKKDYKTGPFPQVSKTGKWADVGHYVQLIWSNTRKLGCAKATAAGNDYLVCRYFPSGNWEGQYAIKPDKPKS
jgi:hypothetical protein